MKIAVQKSNQRGHANYQWLDTKYSFSFADYFNPEQMGFGKLRVLNDDTILGGGGFAMHHHDNMEIITIVLDGELAHQDSLGNGGIIRANEVQVMSAGSGINHSEFNHSPDNPVSLFQIWIETKQQNIQPSYDQRSFDSGDWQDQIKIVASGQASDNALYIHQLARISLLQSQDKKLFNYALPVGMGLYVFNISGQATINNNILKDRDAAAISAVPQIEMTLTKNTLLLLIEVPL